MLLVAISVGPAPDDLDGVVDAFDNAGIERMAAAGRDSVPLALQSLGELFQGSHPALLSLFEPLPPSLVRPGWLSVEPEPFELVA